MSRSAQLNRILGGIGIAAIPAILIYSAMPNSESFVTPKGDDVTAQTFLLGRDPPTPESFSPLRVVARQPLVTGFETLTAAEADRQVDDDELVLAVELNGEARAWPLNVMTDPEREVFNDTLGGKAIAATW